MFVICGNMASGRKLFTSMRAEYIVESCAIRDKWFHADCSPGIGTSTKSKTGRNQAYNYFDGPLASGQCVTMFSYFFVLCVLLRESVLLFILLLL